MTVALRPFDPAEYLDDSESLAAYLEDALATGDIGDSINALGVVGRAKGMTQIASEAGVARPALYRSLSASGRPEFATVMRVLKAVGVSLHTAAKTGEAAISAVTAEAGQTVTRG